MDFWTKIRTKLSVMLNRSKLWQASKLEGERLKMAEHGYVYQNNNIKAKFYLPNYNKELIQAKIIVDGNYYESDELHYVFFEHNKGQIGEAIKDHCVLDIGTNIGNHTLYFLLECGASKVHCFEPMERVYDILLKNIDLNHVQNKVELHHVAVGARSSRAKLSHYDSNNLGATEIKYNNHGDYQVVAIDDLQIEDRISFVKIDIEGFEYEALKGMKQTIEKHHPYMMIEIRDDNYKAVTDFMSLLGYRSARIKSGINYLFSPIKDY